MRPPKVSDPRAQISEAHRRLGMEQDMRLTEYAMVRQLYRKGVEGWTQLYRARYDMRKAIFSIKCRAAGQESSGAQ